MILEIICLKEKSTFLREIEMKFFILRYYFYRMKNNIEERFLGKTKKLLHISIERITILKKDFKEERRSYYIFLLNGKQY